MGLGAAAQAGAEYAMLNGFSTSAISGAVTGTFPTITANPAPTQFCGCPSQSGVTTASVVSPPCSLCADGSKAGTYVSVSAQGTYTTLINYPVIPNSFTFAAQSTVRIQ